MNKLEMLKFGRTLTDRPYGNQVAKKIAEEETFPIMLDFKGVISLGSSFGDEVLGVIHKKGQSEITIFNANGAVRSCLEKVAEDLHTKIVFE